MSTPKNKVYVGNLSYKTTEDAVRDHFQTNVPSAEIVKVQMIMDRNTTPPRPKGFGFIEFATDEQANSALILNDKELDGRKLKVMIAEERKPRTEGGSRPRTGGFNRERNNSYGDRHGNGNRRSWDEN